MVRLGILASHTGTNFQAIIDACEKGELDASPVIAISNNSKSLALSRARKVGIDAAHLSSKAYPNEDELDTAILDSLVSHQVNLVVTLGYMKKLGPKVLDFYKGRILNIHPSLLPRHGGKGMFGLRIHEAVLASGDMTTGVTIHQVDGNYDTGKIIAQTEIPVLREDTADSLAARVLEVEHRFLIEVLSRQVDSLRASDDT
jgi:phosphoribosylglycinamide formyltransferase-1